MAFVFRLHGHEYSLKGYGEVNPKGVEYYHNLFKKNVIEDM